jgi:ABC-type glutathione transport system ATPase component
MAENLLEIRDLLIEAEIDGIWKPIVNGLSLNLQKGEIVGLIGESGAGKSTLGLAALGYTKPGCRIGSSRDRSDSRARNSRRCRRWNYENFGGCGSLTLPRVRLPHSTLPIA